MIGKQIAFAKSVLRTLEEYGFTAIVAGGAPRDWLLGKPATDIDVYIQVPSHHIGYPASAFEEIGFSQVERLSTQTSTGERNEESESDIESYDSMEGLICVYNSLFVGNNILNVQLIQIEDSPRLVGNDLLEMVTNNFQDICQAWLLSDISPLDSSPAFREAHNTQVSEFRVNNRHLAKMRTKFPTYTFNEVIVRESLRSIWEALGAGVGEAPTIRSSSFVPQTPSPSVFPDSWTNPVVNFR